jgi:hypothetical protein
MAETETAESTSTASQPAVSAEDLARLQSEHAQFKAKVGEFRTTNVNLLKERDDLSARLKEYETKLAEVSKPAAAPAPNGVPHDPETIKKLIKEATSDIEARFEREREARIKAEQREREKDFDAQFADAASKTPGFIPAALPDARERARRVFVDEGGTWVLKIDGEVKRRADGEPYSPADWFANDLKKSAPHFFAAGVNGGGAAGSGANGAGGAKTISRSEFDALPPDVRMRRITKEGWKVTDD